MHGYIVYYSQPCCMEPEPHTQNLLRFIPPGALKSDRNIPQFDRIQFQIHIPSKKKSPRRHITAGYILRRELSAHPFRLLSHTPRGLPTHPLGAVGTPLPRPAGTPKLRKGRRSK